jgi:hypothetical protein
MQNKTIFIIIGVVAGCFFLGAICCVAGIFLAVPKLRDAADRAQRKNDLKQVVQAMHNYHSQHNKMPTNANDLQPFLLGSPVSDRLRRGEIEVVWNAARLTEQSNGTSNVIYAWDTKPAGNGSRLVVMMDGMALELTEAEFQTKPKAAKVKTGQ